MDVREQPRQLGAARVDELCVRLPTARAQLETVARGIEGDLARARDAPGLQILDRCCPTSHSVGAPT
jgi:hypothetical protein